MIYHVRYDNGASAILVDGKLEYIIYNTGDEIWFSSFNNKYIPVKIKTHDGLYWEIQTYNINLK